MRRPTEASRIGLLVMKTSCCFHHSNLTHWVRLNGMRLLLWVCPYQLFAVSAFRSVGKHIFTSVPQKMFWADFRQSKTNTSIRICRAAQTNQKISDSFNLSFYRCLCSVFCVHRRMHNHRIFPNGFTPVVVHIYQVCTIHRPRNF